MAAKPPETVFVAEATAAHPRHGGADLIERRDGSIFLAKMLIYSSSLRQQAGDDAPSDIVNLTSHDGGRSWWSEQRQMVTRGPKDHAAYTPSFLRLRNGDVLFRYEMYHRFVQDQPFSISSYVCRSTDDCNTFALNNPTPIWRKSSHHGGSQGDLRQLSTGRIIVPTVCMQGTALQDDGKGLAPSNTSKAGCFYSDDEGATWRECDNYVELPMRGAMEPKIEELKNGQLLMVMRTQLGSVFKSISNDGGQTWGKAQTTGLIAPESCPGLRRIPQTGDLLLIWNNSRYDSKFDHYGLRTPLSAAISRDDGLTWSRSKSIEMEPDWEYTNPAILITNAGKVLIAYEASKYENTVHPGKLGRSRMHLKLAIFDVEWLYE